MAKKKRKRQKTELQKAYQKEHQRLQRAVRRAEKQGYVFEQSPVPNVPKKISTRALESIKKKKTSDIYKKAYWLDQETGELIPALQHKEDVKRAAVEKRKKTIEEKKKKEQDDTQPYYPTIDIVQIIKDRLSAFPSSIEVFSISAQKKITVSLDGELNALLDIMDKNLRENEEAYRDYLLDNEDYIADLIIAAEHIKYEEEITPKFSNLAKALNMGYSLDLDEAEDISDMLDFI